MGAWGIGNFENDDVLDWLPDTQGWADVEEALSPIALAPGDAELLAGLCAIALGAAELVAASRGGPEKTPVQAREWARQRRDRCPEELRRIAVRVVQRIERNSELQELFDDGERNEEWHELQRELIRRLETVE